MANKKLGIFKLIVSPVLFFVFAILGNYIPEQYVYVPIIVDILYIFAMIVDKSTNYGMRSLFWRCDRSEGYDKSFADISSIPFFFKTFLLPIIEYILIIGSTMLVARFIFNITSWVKLISYSSIWLSIDLIISGISDIKNSKYSIDF